MIKENISVEVIYCKAFQCGFSGFSVWTFQCDFQFHILIVHAVPVYVRPVLRPAARFIVVLLGAELLLWYAYTGNCPPYEFQAKRAKSLVFCTF